MDTPLKNRSQTRSICLPSQKTGDSQTDLQSSREWTSHKEGFPLGMTVDTLKQFRRKQTYNNCNRPTDNLHVEEGSLKGFISEYERQFKAPSLDELIRNNKANKPRSKAMEGNNDATYASQQDGSKSFSLERPRRRRPGSHLKLENVPMDFATEKLEKFIVFPNAERTKSLRRNTALKPEGEFFTETEFQREFHAHGNFEKTRSLKHPSNLKLEGLFETLTSEQREKYIAYLICQRPMLEKRQTQLKLEGQFDFTTECQMKYLPPGTQPRHPLRKRSTSLKLDGEADYTPEYRHNFVDLPRSRPLVLRPHGQLNSEGELDLRTESRSKFIEFPLSRVPMSAKLENNIRLEGDLSLNPEYTEQFKNHGRSKSEIIRHRDNLNLEGEITYETENDKYIPSFATSKASSREHLASANYSSKSEYNSQYIDFPRNRPQFRKPSTNFEHDKRTPLDMITENSSQYKSHGPVVRTSPKIRPGSLQPEGGIQGEPEYKNQFVEYPVNYQRSPKPQDSLSGEYPSFQVIDYKPEPLMPSVTPDQPSFRLQVQNVDDKPRGFYKSPDRIYPAEAVVSRSLVSSPHHQAALQAAMKRREEQLQISQKIDSNGNEPAFTVLDNCPNQNEPWSFPNVTDNISPITT